MNALEPILQITALPLISVILWLVLILIINENNE